MIQFLFGEEPFHQEPGLVRWRYVVKPEHFNPAGTLHGGVLSTILDGAMGHAVFTRLIETPGTFSAAINLHVDFLFATREPGATLTIEAKVVQIGKRIAFTEGTVINAEGRALARASGSHAILTRT